MNLRKSDDGFKVESVDLIGILAYEAEPATVCLDPLRAEMRDFCRRVVVNEGFKGKAGTSLVIQVADEKVRWVVVCGLGKSDGECEEAVRKGAFAVAAKAAAKGAASAAIYAPKAEERRRARSLAEGAMLAGYRFKKYVAPDQDDKFRVPDEVVVMNADERGLAEGISLGGAQVYTRQLANEPANVINPVTLAAEAMKLAEDYGLECEIWDEKRIEEEKMGAYLAVARGSDNPPRFIRVTYKPKDKCIGHAVFVGKGLTFDSGGLDIKPADFMLTMKGDKSGACAVLGAVRAAAELRLPWKVTALIAAAENMPDGSSYRPDDILRARNGKTIEVNNTDAEGRLTLADALCFASELKPDFIVDIATLTGACAVALGPVTAGLFTNNDAFGDKVLSAAKASGERLWKLPMDDEFLRKTVKSPVADLINSAGRQGGAITAAMFLEAFVGKDIPWVHLDMAAVDYIKEPRGYYVTGASGYGVRTLAALLMEK